jgi:hypothetical protein
LGLTEYCVVVSWTSEAAARLTAAMTAATRVAFCVVAASDLGAWVVTPMSM